MHSNHGTKLGLYSTYSVLFNNCCILLHSSNSVRSVTPFKICFRPIFRAPQADLSYHAYLPYSSSCRLFIPYIFFFNLFLLPCFVFRHLLFHRYGEFNFGDIFSVATITFELDFFVCRELNFLAQYNNEPKFPHFPLLGGGIYSKDGHTCLLLLL